MNTYSIIEIVGKEKDEFFKMVFTPFIEEEKIQINKENEDFYRWLEEENKRPRYDCEDDYDENVWCCPRHAHQRKMTEVFKFIRKLFGNRKLRRSLLKHI